MSVTPYPNRAGSDSSNIPVRLVAGTGPGSSAANPLYVSGGTGGGSSSSGTATSSSANVTTVALPASSAGSPAVAVLAANASRKDALFYNSNTAAVLLLLGSQTISQTLFTKSLQVGETWPLPFDYVGPIQGLSTGAAGSIQVTELT